LRIADCVRLTSRVASHCRGAVTFAAALLLGACQTLPPAPPPAIKTVTQARYEKVAFETLPALADADLVAAWPAWLASCRAFERGNGTRRAAWQPACAAAAAVDAGSAAAIRAYLRERFDAWRVLAETREDTAGNGALIGVADRGRITGYYEPLLNGSRTKAPPYTVPLHRPPDDLLIVDLASLHPELAGKRVRGRLVETPNGKRVVPYWSREELTNGARLAGAELLWVDDPIEAFFLQVQGSGRVRLPDGSVVRVGYADVNGHPYRSIGRWLVERGELKLEDASMQGIQAWARANPQRLDELLNQNPSYVFFRELPLGDPGAGPLGALAVPLTAGYSVAVDPQYVPLGAPVVISTQHPATNAPLVRLMAAQDTGGAIRGPLRFDFFWGTGREAGAVAGRQRHDVATWILVPKGLTPAALIAR
jgi:membrane-bound lytic murein transglycosylase A